MLTLALTVASSHVGRGAPGVTGACCQPIYPTVSQVELTSGFQQMTENHVISGLYLLTGSGGGVSDTRDGLVRLRRG